MKRIFLDGSAGTTGLRLYDRLRDRQDCQITVLEGADRKDPKARKEALNHCDIAFWCLPDDAAREAEGWIENPEVTVIDTSTAHRTQAGWAYGFPELGEEYRAAVAAGNRIAVPGCHASGVIALIKPLTEAGLLAKTALISCHSVTGYSGGGKNMIAQYQQGEDPLFKAPRQYALGQSHKHLKEMQAVTGLEQVPIFCPIVADFYSGMVVTVPVFASQLAPGVTAEHIKELYQQRYHGPVVRYRDGADEGGFFSAAALAGTDKLEVSVAGNPERILLLARYDNLGKGASGAAVQCMNLRLGAEETAGLIL